jgi:hypothetical protein
MVTPPMVSAVMVMRLSAVPARLTEMVPVEA